MPGSLSARLARLTRAEAGLLDALAEQVSVRPAPADRGRAGILFRPEAGDWEAWLVPLSGPDGPLRLHGEDGRPDALRAALAMAAIEPLIAAIEGAWSTPLDATALTEESPTLAVRVERGGSAALLAVRAPEGLAPARRAARPDPARVAALPLRAEWRLIGPALNPARLARIACGDLLLIAASPGGALHAGGSAWPGRASFAPPRFQIHQRDEVSMFEEQDWAAARTAVEVVIDGGAIPVGRLAALRPGSIVELPAAGASLPVELRASGVRIGRGELVAVGEAYGVMLTDVAEPAPVDAAPVGAMQA